MSWQTGTLVVLKSEAEAAIRNVGVAGEMTAAAADQLAAAQRAALELLKTVPGPKVQISMGGHGNGTGWAVPSGWGPDFITVTVTQYA